MLASPLPLKARFRSAAGRPRDGDLRAAGRAWALQRRGEARASSCVGPLLARCAATLLSAHPLLTPQQVVASSLDTLDSVLLSNFTSKEDLVACLKVGSGGGEGTARGGASESLRVPRGPQACCLPCAHVQALRPAGWSHVRCELPGWAERAAPHRPLQASATVPELAGGPVEHRCAGS